MRVLVNELPMHARHHRRLEKWVICCIWSDLHITISAATFAPAFLFPACLTVYLRRDTSHLFLNPFFGDNLWKADRESWSQVHFYPCLLTYSGFLFSEDVADRNVTFGKLRVVFQFSQPFQHPHMNTIQPCGFEYKKIFHGVSNLLLLHCWLSFSFPKCANSSGGGGLAFLWRSKQKSYHLIQPFLHNLSPDCLLHPATDLHFPQLPFVTGIPVESLLVTLSVPL